jgi:hypothetical protein
MFQIWLHISTDRGYKTLARLNFIKFIGDHIALIDEVDVIKKTLQHLDNKKRFRSFHAKPGTF